jgi:hypothetical protein
VHDEHGQVRTGVVHEPSKTANRRTGIGEMTGPKVEVNDLSDTAADRARQPETRQQSLGIPRTDHLVPVERGSTVVAHAKCCGLRDVVEEKSPAKNP